MTRLYAVTGATGQLGGVVVEALLDRGIESHDVVAVVRSPARAADLAARGVRVRVADYSDPDGQTDALTDVSRLLLVSSSDAQHRISHHRNVVAAARAAGVARVIYTSMLNAQRSHNPLAADHRETEQELHNSRLPFTILRNGWYSENYTYQLSSYVESGEIRGTAGRGRVSAAARADYGLAAAAALLDDQEQSRIYELGGPGFDLDELAHTITEVIGRRVAYHDLAADDYAAALKADGMDAATAAFVVALDRSIARGELATGSHDLAQLLGREPTSLSEVIRREWARRTA